MAAWNCQRILGMTQMFASMSDDGDAALLIGTSCRQKNRQYKVKSRTVIHEERILPQEARFLAGRPPAPECSRRLASSTAGPASGGVPRAVLRLLRREG